MLDEPLSALDEDTRAGMVELLRSVQRRTGVTTLHVTHNLHEAHRLADTVFLLKDGIIRQEALPDRVMPPVGMEGRLTR